VGSSFQRQGAAYRKQRLVIFKEDRLGGRPNHAGGYTAGVGKYNINGK